MIFWKIIQVISIFFAKSSEIRKEHAMHVHASGAILCEGKLGKALFNPALTHLMPEVIGQPLRAKICH